MEKEVAEEIPEVVTPADNQASKSKSGRRTASEEDPPARQTQAAKPKKPKGKGRGNRRGKGNTNDREKSRPSPRGSPVLSAQSGPRPQRQNGRGKGRQPANIVKSPVRGRDRNTDRGDRREPRNRGRRRSRSPTHGGGRHQNDYQDKGKRNNRSNRRRRPQNSTSYSPPGKSHNRKRKEVYSNQRYPGRLRQYPIELLLTYKDRPECMELPEELDLPDSVLRHNLSPKSRGKTFPFTDGSHQRRGRNNDRNSRKGGNRRGNYSDDDEYEIDPALLINRNYSPELRGRDDEDDEGGDGEIEWADDDNDYNKMADFQLTGAVLDRDHDKDFYRKHGFFAGQGKALPAQQVEEERLAKKREFERVEEEKQKKEAKKAAEKNAAMMEMRNASSTTNVNMNINIGQLNMGDMKHGMDMNIDTLFNPQNMDKSLTEWLKNVDVNAHVNNVHTNQHMPEMPKMPNVSMDASALEAKLRSGSGEASRKSRSRQDMGRLPPLPDHGRPGSPGDEYVQPRGKPGIGFNDMVHPGSGHSSPPGMGPSNAPSRGEDSRPRSKPTKVNFADIWAQAGLPDEVEQADPMGDSLEQKWNGMGGGDDRRSDTSPFSYADMPDLASGREDPTQDPTRALDQPTGSMEDYYNPRSRDVKQFSPTDRLPRQNPHSNPNPHSSRNHDAYEKQKSKQQQYQQQQALVNELPNGYTMDQVTWLATQRNVPARRIIDYLRQKQGLAPLKDSMPKLQDSARASSSMAMRQIAANAYERKMESLWKKHNLALRRRYLQNYSNYFQQLRNKARAMIQYQDGMEGLSPANQMYSLRMRELQRMAAQQHSQSRYGMNDPREFSPRRMGGTQSPPSPLTGYSASGQGNARVDPMTAQGLMSPRSHETSPISSPNHNLQQVMLNRMAHQQLAQQSLRRGANQMPTGQMSTYQRQILLKQMLAAQQQQQQQYRDIGGQPSYSGDMTPPHRATSAFST